MGWFSEIWFQIMAAGRGFGQCRRLCLRPHPGHKLGIVACHIWTHLFGGKTPPCSLHQITDEYSLFAGRFLARLEQAFVEPQRAKRCRGARRCAQEHTVVFRRRRGQICVGDKSAVSSCPAIKASGFAAAACCC